MHCCRYLLNEVGSLDVSDGSSHILQGDGKQMKNDQTIKTIAGIGINVVDTTTHVVQTHALR